MSATFLLQILRFRAEIFYSYPVRLDTKRLENEKNIQDNPCCFCCLNNPDCLLWSNNNIRRGGLLSHWSRTLTPNGTSVGKAIVIYDPGLSGTAKGVADKVAIGLQSKGYTVTLAGVKSSAAAHTTGYDVIVIGGPIYAGELTNSIKDKLSSLVLSHGQSARIGVFGSGQGATSLEDIAQIKHSIPIHSDTTLQDATVVKIGSSEDLNARTQDFVNQLLS